MNLRKRGVSKSGSWERGQSTLEFALTSVLMLMLTFMMIEFSRAIYTASVIQAAAQEGARAGVVNLDDVAPTVESRLILLDPDRAQIQVSQPDSDSVSVEVIYQFEFLIPFIAQLDDDGLLDLRSDASMIIR